MEKKSVFISLHLPFEAKIRNRLLALLFGRNRTAIWLANKIPANPRTFTKVYERSEGYYPKVQLKQKLYHVCKHLSNGHRRARVVGSKDVARSKVLHLLLTERFPRGYVETRFVLSDSLVAHCADDSVHLTGRRGFDLYFYEEHFCNLCLAG